MQRTIRLAALILLLPGFALAGQLSCPDTPGDTRIREAMATSAPEVKVPAAAQNDSSRWSPIVKPLIQKAIKQAKEQRGHGDAGRY
jgi:hypothetical protein